MQAPLVIRGNSRQRNRQRTRCARSPSALIGSIAALTLCLAQSAFAASGTWNGAGNNGIWSDPANWAGGIPGTGDTATFNGPAGTFATLDVGGVTVNTIIFTSSAAAAHAIGAGAVNAQTLTLNNGGAITMTGTVVQDELFNAALVLGTDATAASYTFTNNSTTNLLNIAGNVAGGTGGAAAAKTLTVTGAGSTLISGVISNGGATSLGLTKSGAGNLTLRGANLYTGLTNIQGGTLTLDANTGSGSIAGAALAFSGGSGTFSYLQSAAGSTQSFSSALTFTAGAGNVQSTYGGGGSGGITFASLSARSAGATGNFVISGGTNGTSNSISFGTVSAGFQNQGLFFNGSGYAFMNTANGFVRGINYGGDAGTATTGAGATIGALGGQHVQVTGSIAGQTTLSINTLNLSGSNLNFVIGAPAAQTLTISNGGILKSGGGTAQISGGIVAAGAAELVIRADQATDTMKIDSVISGSGGVTITGAGKVFLTAANTFTGNVNIAGGTLVMNFAYASDIANPLGAAGARTITLNGGGTVQLLGNTYNPAATTAKGFVIGTGGGTFNITAGQLQFDDASQFSGAGDLTVNSSGAGIFLVGAAAVGYTGFTGNVTINGGTVKTPNVSSLGNTANRSITVNSGGSLDVQVAAFDPGAGTAITLNGNGLNNTGALTNSSALVSTIANGVTLASNASVGSTAAGGLGLSGVISGGFSLTKVGTGAGAVTLSGLNTYTGSTIVNAGTLIADSVTNAAPINSASGLVFSGTGTFQYKGLAAATKSMTLNGLTLAGGAGILDDNNLGSSTTLTLGTLTRPTGGGSVDFKATTGVLGGGANINIATTPLINGIFGGFATVAGGANLAAKDGSNNVAAFGAYTNINTNGSVIPNGAANNVRIQTVSGAGNATIGAGTTDANTLFQNTAAAVLVDTSAGILRLGSQGGIISSPTAVATGTVTIGIAANSGTLTAGGADNTNGEIIVNTASANTVALNSVIADNGLGVVSLNLTGLVAGTLSLAGTNTYSGVTSITNGIIQINGPLGNINTAGVLGKGSAAGSAADLVINGGTLQLSANAPTGTDRLFSVGLGGATLLNNNAAAANAISFTGTGAIGLNGQSGSRTLTLTGTNTGTNTLVSVLGDNGGPTYLTKSAAGTWILTGNNTYGGTTTVSGGILQVGNGGITGSLGTGFIAGTGGTIAFNHSDNVTLNNLISAGIIRQASASTLSLNNGANVVTTLQLNGTDGGIIDLLADVGISNVAAAAIAATNSGTINATGGGRILLNSQTSSSNGLDFGAAAGKILTINAVIANGASGSNTYEAFNAGFGTTILNADNTFTNFVITGQTVQVVRIANQGVAAPLGAATAIQLNGANAILKYTGAGETSDRIISLVGTTTGGFIDQSATSGLLKFTTNFATPGAGAKVLSLQGSNAGTGEISGIIGDNTANAFNTALTKAGTGTWTLSGANTYTGATTVNGGALIIGNALAVQNSVVTISTVANTATTGLVFGAGIGSFSIGGLNGTQAMALSDSADVPLTALTIGGTNSAGGTYSGSLSGTTNITKTTATTQTLTGVNTFTGKVVVTGGLIAINAETGLGANPGVATADQLTLNGGGIGAVGSSLFTIDDANRGITIGALGGSFDAQALAVMTIAKSIAGGANPVTKSGPGIVIFMQPNVYGSTNITGGTLVLVGAGTVGAGGVTINGGALSGPAAGAITIGATSGSLIYPQIGAGADVSSTLTLTSGGTLTVDVVNAAGTVTFASAFGNATTANFTKVGLGTLTLQGGLTGNTFTGTTTAGAGNLAIDFSTVTAPASGVNAGTSPLTFRGGTLTLVGFSGSTDSQNFASTALLEGGSTLTATQNAAATLGASLGLISRDGTTNKGTVNFVLPTTGSYATTSANNTSGILGGWAVVGGTAWATVTAGNIASYAGDAAALPVSGSVATTNYSQTTATAITLTASETVNALRISGAGAIALATSANLTVSGGAAGGAGGILATVTGSITATPSTTLGFLTAGGGNELLIYTNTGATLTISAAVGGPAGAITSGLTKSGGGTLSLNNATAAQANNYVGTTTINGGILIIDAANRLGASTGITLNGGALQESNTFTVTQPLTLGLSGGTLNYTGGAGNGGWSSATAIAFLGSGSRTLTFNNNNAGRFATLSAAIGESGGPTSIVVNASSDTGLLQLSGANSTNTGNTTINRGVLRLNAANALSIDSNLTFNGPTTNRAILEFNATFGSSFTRDLGTLPGQVQWTGNGGFSSSNVANFVVNLGGLATPATVTWNSGSFVPSGSSLQFAQNAANSNYGSGTVEFKNPIDLAGAARSVDVADNGSQGEAILSGLISGAAGSVLNKTGTGVLTLTADNTSSTNVAVTLANGGGALIFANTNAIPGTTGATVTINPGGSVVLTGSTNPLPSIGARIAPTSGGAIALDVNSSASIDFSAFSALSLGAYNPTMGQAVIFTGSITPFTDNVYRLGTGRSATNTAAITGNGLINFAANQGNNVLVLPVANQLRDAGSPRSLVVSSGATYLTSYNTFTGGTRVGQLTGQTGNANIGIGNDAALGAGLVQFSPTGTTVGTGFIGGINGDHFLTNNVTVGAAGNWVASADLASDGLANAGAMTYAGKTTLTGAVLIFSRSRTAIFTGDIAATGSISISGGAISFLTTPAGAVGKSYVQTTTIPIGQSLTIDSNASLGAGTNTLTIGTGTAAATNTFLRIQPGTVSDVVLTGRAVTVGANFQPVFDVPGSPVTNVTSNLVIPGVASGAGTTQIVKIGLGTLTLRGANTWTSTAANGLQIYGGTVVMDVATSATARVTNATTMALTLGTSTAATAATFGGGGTFALSAGTNAGAQIFTILQSAAKDNALSLSATGAGSAALTFNGATVNRTGAGGTLAISASGTTTITLTGTIAPNTGASIAGAIVLDGGASGNAFATINGTDWAARNAANQIVPLGSAGAGAYTLSTATALSGNADMDIAVPTTTLAGATTVTSLRFNAGAAETVDLNASNLVTGGILVGTGALALSQTISASGAGALLGITGKDLVLINAAAADTAVLTISAPIIDNASATALTKSGPGTVVLGGNNAFTSSIFLNGGVLSVATAGTAAAANPLGQMVSGATNLIMNGGTLRYTGAVSATTDRGATFNSYSKIEVSNPTGTLVATGPLVGFAGSTAMSVVGLLNKTGPGALSLSGSTDNNTLSAMVTAGTLNLDKASTAAIHAVSAGAGAAALIVNGGTAKITGSGGDQIFNASSVVVNGGGTFDFNGQGETFDALAGTGTVTNTGANGVPITLTLGDATVAGAQTMNGPNTPNAAAAGVAGTGLNFFSGNLTDNGSNKLALTKAGPGTQFFSGSGNTYSGDTTIISGSIRFAAANVLPSGAGKGNVILTGTTVIFGLTVPGTLDMGGFNQTINGLTGSAGSIVTSTPLPSVVANQTNTLIVGLNDQTTQFDGIFQDGYVIQPGVAPVGRFGFVAVDKVGAGALTLTGTNTNTGTVTVDSGRIDLNNATGNALSTNVTINPGGTVKLLASNQVADANTVTTSGGTFDLNGKNETVGVSLTGGSILDGAGGGALSSNSAFDLQSGTVSAKLSGTSGLNKTTGGTVTLGGAQVHSFSGATNVSA
ncbi:MAG: autotransporter-associated beta strand repeat-containing protein, partial [Chthoniobacteraceae bacterium]